ncbi:MAG: hypothetical protein JXA67_05100, partial [Micromonosporaceae bacterium]|nr:hypothetical protein [Micromonosporaceae bacterium]
MKWVRAVHHLESLATSCAKLVAPSPVFSLRVTQLWAVGDILGPPCDLESVTVALGVDLPAEEVAWFSQPPGAQHWTNATRLAQNPIRAWWRSVHAPIWNHRIRQPALVWDEAGGIRQETLAAIRDGEGERVRTPPPSE